MNTVALEKFAVSGGGSVDPSKYPSEEFDLYSIPAYDKYEPEVSQGSEIGSTKKTVQPGDVLLSRIVPHIRRVWVVGPSRGRRQVGSGEWIIFRGDSFDSNYLRHMLMADPFHKQFMQTVAGVGGSLLRARPSEVEKIKIPLPPLSEQKRIAAILDKADAVRRKRQQAVKLTEELLRSVFLDMFGDPVTNPKGWEVKPLAEEITFMTSGSRGWAEHYSDHGSKFIRIQNVKNGKLHFNDIQYVKAPDNKEAARTKVQENDLLISITADLGRTAVVDKQTADEGAHINQHLALVRLSNAINPHFVAAYLESQGGKRQFLQLDQAAVKSGLNFDSIKSLRIFNPPLVLQEQYATAVESVENTKVKLKGAADTSDSLFTSLLQRAFRGEL